MAIERKEYRVLSVGFRGDIRTSLKNEFNIICSISDDLDAEINWTELHLMQTSSIKPNLSSAMLSCLNEVKKHYLKFSDINSRRFYYINERESEVYNAFILTFYQIYRLLVNEKINLVLHSNIPHEGFDYLIYLVSKYLKIESILCYQSLFANYFWMSRTLEDFGKISLNPNLQEINTSCYVLPNNWFYMKGANRDHSYSFRHAALEIIRKPYRIVPALVRSIYAHEYRLNIRRLVGQKINDGKYIYFPLHLQPELTTSALGGDFSDQLLALESLSTWIPGDYQILIKENPKQTEKQRGKLFYKRLSALKNVRLLPPGESSIDLIRNSSAVATITGTAGWEALFYGKPVLIFGLAWYREFAGVMQFNFDLNFNEFIRITPPPRDVLVNELDHALQTAGLGVVDEEYAPLVEGFDSKVNGKSVVRSIVDYITLASPSKN